jgi:tetratricopeptide (TPR) repeat protein
MQKLASLGYVGLQKSSGSSAAVTGTDPKDKIATANKVIEAAGPSLFAESKPDRALAALQPVISTDPNLYLAEYTLGVALAEKGKYAEAGRHLHKAIELQPDSGWAHYENRRYASENGGFQNCGRASGNRDQPVAWLCFCSSFPRRSL